MVRGGWWEGTKLALVMAGRPMEMVGDSAGLHGFGGWVKNSRWPGLKMEMRMEKEGYDWLGESSHFGILYFFVGVLRGEIFHLVAVEAMTQTPLS